MVIAFNEGGGGSAPSVNAVASALGIDLGGFGVLPGATMGAPTDPAMAPVYMGPRPYTEGGLFPDKRGGFIPSRYRDEQKSSDTTRSVDDLQSMFMDADEAHKRKLALMLALAGYAGAGSNSIKDAQQWAQEAPLPDVFAAHASFLQDAADLWRRGKKVTPDKYLKQLIDYRMPDKWDGDLDSLLDGEGGGAGGSGSPFANATRTTTTTNIDLMDPQDAKFLIRGLLQNELGRDPTQAEYEDFISAIHAAERANPDEVTTTTKYDALGSPVKSSSTRNAGITEAGLGQMATEKLREQPEWSTWQAVGTYAPALFAALDSPVEGV